MKSYLVNEVYPCLQGEGIHLGKPSVLLRLQICNLRCVWCDTPYTHTYTSDPLNTDITLVSRQTPTEKVEQAFKRMSLTDLVDLIVSHGHRHLIVSGGEPTLQNFIPLLTALPHHTAEVETNGTRIPHLNLPGFRPTDYTRCDWNVSPKGSNADEVWNDEALAFWTGLSRTHSGVRFKFVVRENEPNDFSEVLKFQSQWGCASDRIMLMPEGTSPESQMGKTQLAEFCMHHGFRYTPRLHVLLFGVKRGV